MTLQGDFISLSSPVDITTLIGIVITITTLISIINIPAIVATIIIFIFIEVLALGIITHIVMTINNFDIISIHQYWTEN